MRLLSTARIVALVLVLEGCTGIPAGNLQRASAGEGDGVLAGRVSRGPVSPVERPGDPPYPGVANAQIDIARPDGTKVTSTETDGEGNFRMALPGGTYVVTMPSLYGAMYSKDVPATVTIAPGAEQHLNVLLDTGIR